MSAFLFSVDVEDPPPALAGGAPLPELVDRYLAFLEAHRGTGTFFVVGAVARRHPEMIRAIAAAGHELACHSDRHVPLDRLDPASFRDDTLRNLEALDAAGAGPIAGYRAPCLSLVRRTRWAHAVLAELGFAYSSSVLPAVNPQFGWPGFGREPRQVGGGLWEIPVSLHRLPFPPLPLGGVYARILPRWAMRSGLRAARRLAAPVVFYCHPFDIDNAPLVRRMSRCDRQSPRDWLLRRNRGRMLERLEMAAHPGPGFISIGPFAASLGQGGAN